MIDRLVSFALSQRFIVIVAMISLAAWGVVSFKNLPIDAYPDLMPPRVQIVTQWPGHAAWPAGTKRSAFSSQYRFQPSTIGASNEEEIL